jgi:hypothetical protein
VPEAAIDENREPLSRECDIGSGALDPHVQAIPHPESPEAAAKETLRSGVATSDSRHQGASSRVASVMPPCWCVHRSA